MKQKMIMLLRKIHKRKLQTQDYKTSHILHVSPHFTSSCRETLREAVISSNEIMWYLTWIRFSTYSCSPSLFSWWSSSVICWVHREAALLQRSSSNLLLLPSSERENLSGKAGHKARHLLFAAQCFFLWIQSCRPPGSLFESGVLWSPDLDLLPLLAIYKRFESTLSQEDAWMHRNLSTNDREWGAEEFVTLQTIQTMRWS